MFKKFLTAMLITLTISLAVISVSAEIIASGTFDEDDDYCGDVGTVWTIDSEGVLEISNTSTIRGYADYIPEDYDWAYGSYWGDYNVKEVIIHEGVDYIIQAAFAYIDFERITLPASLKSIGDNTFFGCSNIKEVIYNGTDEQWKKIYISPYAGDKFIEVVTNSFGEVPIEGTVYTNDGYINWIYSKTGLLTLSGKGTITAEKVNMKDYSYYTCRWSDYDVDEIVICEGITGIGENAFIDISLESITLPASLTFIDEEACIYAESMTYNGTYEQWKNIMVAQENEDFIKLALNYFPTVSGKCGKDAIWTCYRNGTVYITGTGCIDGNRELDPYCDEISYVDPLGWGNEVKKIIVGEGITKIGYTSIVPCGNVDYILPSTLMEIADSDYFVEDPVSVYYTGDAEKWSMVKDGSYWPCFDDVTFIDACLVLDPNGGTCSDNVVLVSKDNVTTMPVPQKEGYNFCGWSTQPTDGVLIENPENLTGVTQLYAQWSDVVEHGSCGENTEWTFYTSGKLLISGNGAMEDYFFPTDIPWNPYLDSITSVEISEGITHIGVYTFSACNGIEELIIPQSLISVGRAAFYRTSVGKITYNGSPLMWDKITIEKDNSILNSAEKEYLNNDCTVTYSINTNAAVSATKTSEQVMYGSNADLTVVAIRKDDIREPEGTEKETEWEFLGWNTDKNATESLKTIIVTDDTILYPIFRKVITIDFYVQNNVLKESKTFTLYNDTEYVSVTVPELQAFEDWIPLQWSNPDFDKNNIACVYKACTDAEFVHSVDLFAQYQREISVSYDVGNYALPINSQKFTQDYYAFGTPKVYRVNLPQISQTTNDAVFLGWSKNGDESLIYLSGALISFDNSIVMKAFWKERTSNPQINITEENGLKVVNVSYDVGSVVYYTTDGTTPDESKDLYTKPVTLTCREDITFKAIAYKDGYMQSYVSEADIVLNKVSTPVSSEVSGFIEKNTIIKLETPEPGAEIYYTYDGTIPDENSNLYKSPLIISETTKICAIAIKDGMKNSDEVIFQYTVIDENVPCISISSITKSNEQVTFAIKISENAKTAGGSFNLVYDDSVLAINSSVKGDYLKNIFSNVNKTYKYNTIRVNWASSETIETGTTILLVTFDVINFDAKETSLYLESVKIADTDGVKLPVQVKNERVSFVPATYAFETLTFAEINSESIIVNLENKEQDTGCIIVAVYDYNGSLAHWKYTDVIDSKCSYTLDMDETLMANQKVKVFVWSSLTSIEPLSKTEEILL